MAGPHGITKVGDKTFFISSNGRVFLLDALRPDVDPRNADLTTQLNLTEFIKQNVDANRLNHARLIYDERRNEMSYYYTSKGGTINDSAIIFDFNDVEIGVKASTEDRGEFFEAAWPRIGTDGFVEILVGGIDGLIYRTNAANRNIGGSAAYVGELQYPDTDLRFLNPDLEGADKRFDLIELAILPTGNYDLSIEIIIDGQSLKTITINLGSEGSVFDSAIFDTDKFGGQTIIKHRVPIDACGNQIGLRMFNSGLNQNFQIANVRLYFKPIVQGYES